MTTLDLPPAHCADLCVVSYLKRELVSGALSVGERLKTLEAISACARGPVTAAAIATIEPANDTFAEIVTEALRLALASEDGSAPFILERPAVFQDLLRLNPSLRSALALCRRPGG